jgi:hypothetical protein
LPRPGNSTTVSWQARSWRHDTDVGGRRERVCPPISAPSS